MLTAVRRFKTWRVLATPLVAVGLLSACGGSDSPPPSIASTSDIVVVGTEPGVTPFIANVRLQGSDLDDLSAVRFVIEPKSGSASKPVAARWGADGLRRRGYAASGSGTASIPVFGLYDGYSNRVRMEMEFLDGSTQQLHLDVATDAYVDPNGVYDKPVVRTPRAAGSALGFDFFAMKSTLGTPVVVDSDGSLRWVATGVPSSAGSAFVGDGFVVVAPDSLAMYRLGLDGSLVATSLAAPGYSNFHHNVDTGKDGLLAELDATDGSPQKIESTLVEIDGSTVLKEWDLAEIFRAYMLSHGDDPSAFVRPGVDWFHMNGATYDPRDDTVVVSSRENFVVKLKHATGEIVWIFGDPTKYWYTFPSLRAKALTLTAGGLYPVGQHAPSIRSDGLLMVFNNGAASANQPTGAPVGESRSYSVVSAYAIDAVSMTATETWRFDHPQTLLSDICSSAYEAKAGSILVDYAVADQRNKARLVGLDARRNIVFDIEYTNPRPGCLASWNAVPVAFDDLRID